MPVRDAPEGDQYANSDADRFNAATAVAKPDSGLPNISASPRATAASETNLSNRQSSKTRAEEYAEQAANPSHTPAMRELYRKWQQSEELKSNSQALEVISSLRSLRDAAGSHPDPKAVEQLFRDAKFALDVFEMHNPKYHETEFFVRAKLALMNYEFLKAAQQDKRKGVKTVPENEIYPLLLRTPSLRSKGKQETGTEGLQFSIDDVIDAINSDAYLDLGAAEFYIEHGG